MKPLPQTDGLNNSHFHKCQIVNYNSESLFGLDGQVHGFHGCYNEISLKLEEKIAFFHLKIVDGKTPVLFSLLIRTKKG